MAASLRPGRHRHSNSTASGSPDVALASPSSPPPAYASTGELGDSDSPLGATTPHVAVAGVDALHFDNGSDDESVSSDVLAEFERLDEQLRIHRAPVVQPTRPVPVDPFPFLSLPLELREQVYDEYFSPRNRLEILEIPDGTCERYDFEFTLLRTSKQIWLEALRSWRKNVFVRIETPWPHAVHHLTSDGQVPVVATGTRADMFTQHTGLVQITAPLHGVTTADHTIILLLEDLSKFTEVWYYSALNYTNLNPQICLTFTLRDPYYPADPKPVSLELQRRLLLPFGDVRGLYETNFEGYDDRIVADLRTRMAIPYPTVQEACETATNLLEEGDRLLAESKFESALDLYIRSYNAIHIKISGRIRRILADGFFADDIPSGRYAGQAAMTVRVMIRIRLVSRTIFVLLRLDRPDEAAYSGVRSIKLMREMQNTDMEHFFNEFIGSSDVGSVYAWTAIALMALEKDDKWAKEREQYVGEESADLDNMWRSAERYLSAPKWAADRKRITGEAKRWGVEIPALAGFSKERRSE